MAFNAVQNFPATFTTGAAAAAGLPGISLLRLRDAGGVIELSRGVFRGADAPAPTYADLLALSVRAPAGIICAVSAAAFHGLTDVVVGNLRFGLTGIIWALPVTEGAVLQSDWSGGSLPAARSAAASPRAAPNAPQRCSSRRRPDHRLHARNRVRSEHTSSD